MLDIIFRTCVSACALVGFWHIIGYAMDGLQSFRDDIVERVATKVAEKEGTNDV